MIVQRISLVAVVALLTAAGCDKFNVKDGKRAAKKSPQQEAASARPELTVASADGGNASSASANGNGGETRRPSGMNLRDDWRNQPKEDGKPLVARMDAKQLDGILRAVDPDRRMLTLEARGTQHTFPVDALVHIETPGDHSRGLQGGLAGLQPGTRIMVMAYRYDDIYKIALIRIKHGILAD